MDRKEQIPVHRMDDWTAGIYLKSFAEAKPFGAGYEISQAHRHDFYYCVLLEKGAMEVEVDFHRFHLGDHAIFFTYPGQVHRIISARLEKGWFLAFDPAIIEEKLKDILDQCLAEVMIVPVSAGAAGALSSSVKHIHEIYQDGSQRFRQSVLHALVTAYTYQVADAYLSLERLDLQAHPARSVEITKTFRQILRQQFKSMKKPAEFAARMNLSTSHLNDTVKEVTGFPVTYYIQQESMREAQRLLYHSELSVKEIAGSLGFDDAQYFSRLFSKVTGVSPVAFRNRR